MKKILSAIGKKNLIIISGILLIGIAVYLNLTLPLGNDDALAPDGGDALNNDAYGSYVYDDDKILGQAALVDNMKYDSEDMGAGMGEAGMENVAAKDSEVGANDEENYFAVAVLSRRRARDESIDLLNHIINSAESMPDIVERAMKDIAVIAGDIESEANIEVLVKAKGFDDCIAVVNGDSAQIIVKTEGLMPNEVAQIKEIAYEQAGLMPANVKIIEKT